MPAKKKSSRGKKAKPSKPSSQKHHTYADPRKGREILIDSYEHRDKERLNNPPVGLVDAHTDNGGVKKKKYQYDPHLDPQLVWAGKAEHTSFEVPTVSLHVHERIDPRRIIETVQEEGPRQMSLFEAEKKPLREAIEFYKHKENWTNRLIAGDSLLVMNSLLEKEGMGGKVQMVYFDPPYGIKYGSNFQPFVNKRDVKDGKDEDLTAEPETIKAFRDTWELGIHSYLTYLRDRAKLACDLLNNSGSIFIQISDENVHRVRIILDEIFGPENFVAQINYRSMTPLSQKGMPSVYDYIIWYAKDIKAMKFRPLYTYRNIEDEPEFCFLDKGNGNYEKLNSKQIKNLTKEEREKIFKRSVLTSSGYTPSCASSAEGCRIFLTASSFDGNLGGIRGADARCNADGRKPSGNTVYKAFIVDESRRTLLIPNQEENAIQEDQTRDWVLKANQKYITTDGREFATTSSSRIFFRNGIAQEISISDSDDPIIPGATVNQEFWTGLIATANPDNPDEGFIIKTGTTCSNWTSNASATKGGIGRFSGSEENAPDGIKIAFDDSDNTDSNCNVRKHLICIEQ